MSTKPEVYYGLHFYPGVAEYREKGKDAYRIYIGEEAIKNMGPSFQGCPVFVYHVDKVDLENIREKADGYVVESFYNAMDGKHWVKFIVVSDEAKDAIKRGWSLSNAYIPKELSSGGLCNGVEYDKEVTRGEYEHLAIVPNPRYEESIILTPDSFKQYNQKKEMELKKLSNSKKPKGESSMFNWFKKEKVENAAELEKMSVTLPKSKVEKTLEQVINEYDAVLNMQGYANGDHMVKVGEEEMSVNDLISKHMEMKKNMEDAASKEKEEPKAEEKKENEEEKEPKEKEKEEKEKVEKNAAHFDKLKKAGPKITADSSLDLVHNQIERGKSRYGKLDK